MAMTTKWTTTAPVSPEDRETVEGHRTTLNDLKAQASERGGRFQELAGAELDKVEKKIAEWETLIETGVKRPNEEATALAEQINDFAEEVFEAKLASLTQSEGDQ